jgi:hypothetical protein
MLHIIFHVLWYNLTINLKPTDYENLFCFVPFHCEYNNLITIQHIQQKHIVLNSVCVPMLVINFCGRVKVDKTVTDSEMVHC